jgi:hypothetical protein
MLPLSYVSQRVHCNVAWHKQILQDAGTQACVVMHNTKNESITALSLLARQSDHHMSDNSTPKWHSWHSKQGPHG